MVAPVPSDLEAHSLEDPPLSEGFHWEALDEPHVVVPGPSSRKRSLSESNVASGNRALNFPLATGGVPREPPRKSLHLNSGEPRTVPWVSGSPLPSKHEAEGCPKGDSQRGASPAGNPENSVEEDAGTVSGMEQDDSHGGGTGGTVGICRARVHEPEATKGSAVCSCSCFLSFWTGCNVDSLKKGPKKE